jgi:hypothetical protein
MTADEAAATVRERVEEIRYELTKPCQSQFISDDCKFLLAQYDAAAKRADRLALEMQMIVELALDETKITEEAISGTRVEMHDIARAALADDGGAGNA